MEQVETKEIRPLRHGVKGRLHIPGDKSISHRSVMFSALGSTPVHITNFLHAADCLSTVACMRALGATVEELGATELVVTGNGLHGLREPACVLDAGNSGTTLRLLLGLLAPQPFLATFTGDASLSRRPMGRVVKPLSAMGAKIVGRAQNTLLPLTVLAPDGKLHGMRYESPVASAQVKSALLLAGMFADGATTVVEPVTSRDHTERMLEAFGVVTEKDGTAVTIRPVAEVQAPAAIEVPGDISSAAYWLVLASLLPGSQMVLENVGVNETRTGILDVLAAMGADIVRTNERVSGGEVAADLVVTAAKLHGTTFGKDIMPRLIDEIPVIAVAARVAAGDTVIAGAGGRLMDEKEKEDISLKNLVVAIDGPAGAGKSTVAKLAAKALGYTYIDTGAMYRAVAWKALQQKTPVTDALILSVVKDIDVRLSYHDGVTHVFVNGEEATDYIRTPEVSRIVSQVAALGPVREKMVELQRAMAAEGGVLMDGRGIGTHVLPQADVKIFLTASIEERAQRRYREMREKGYAVELAKLQEDIAARDKADSERAISPLVQAADAVLLDTTGLSIEQVVEKILGMCR